MTYLRCPLPETFAQRVVGVVRALAPGDVVTYGEVAALAGRPGAARGVGAVLAANADPTLPWWRVVNATGRLAPGKERKQGELLRSEGVPVARGHVTGFDRRRPSRARGTARP